MFKLLYLKLQRHPQLGDLEIYFVEENEINNIDQPYTSVIIGPNGSGKSYILRTIIEIFREFYQLKLKSVERIQLSIDIHLKYKYDNDVYEIFTKRWASVNKNGGFRRDYIYLKNKPNDVSLYDNRIKGRISFEKKTGYEIDIKDLKFPSKILASSVFLNDRFPFANSQENDFYQYLGVRRTPSMASTKTFARNTVKYLYEASFSRRGFNNYLQAILNFLEFENHLTITYLTRYNNIFFNGDLTEETLKSFYEKWWNLKEQGVNRSKDNAPWGEYHYQYLLKNDPARLRAIVDFLNKSSRDEHIIQHKPRSRSKQFVVDLIKFDFNRLDLSIIEDLDKLSILTLDEINLLKKETEISVEETSSGEYHLILNFLGVFAKIEHNSLILIDEPEISLHPNWQMKYVTFLKSIFSLYNCHFIICTHSHFLISDLEGKSSSVVALDRISNTGVIVAKLLNRNTYAWSAEEVLLKVFKVPTTRNYFIADKVGEILELVSKSIRDDDLIRNKVRELVDNNIQNLSTEDPLKPVINRLLEKYA